MGDVFSYKLLSYLPLEGTALLLALKVAGFVNL